MPKRPTFISESRRLEHLRRGIAKRWHVMASDGDFIVGFDGEYQAKAAANARNVLSVNCHAEIMFEIKDTKEPVAKRLCGAPMRAGNTRRKPEDS